MIAAIAFLAVALLVFHAPIGWEATFIGLMLGGIADAIRAQKVPAWTLTQRVDALSDAYAKGYRECRDELDAKAETPE